MIEFPSSNQVPPDGPAVRHYSDPHLSRLIVNTEAAKAFGPSNLRFEVDLMQYLTPIYGEFAQQIRDSWRLPRDPMNFPKDPIEVERERIRANLRALADLEEVSPGSSLRLFLADGIRNPGRYSRQQLLIQDDENQQIASGRKPKRRNTLLFLVANYDWNNNLKDLTSMHMTDQSRNILAAHGFGIHIIESINPQDADKRVALYVKRFGEQEKAFLIIRAHGNPTGFTLSNTSNGRMTTHHFEEDQPGWRMMQRLAQQIIVITSSCEAAAPLVDEDNLAQAIFRIPNVIDVRSPSDIASMGPLIFETTEENLQYGVIFFEGRAKSRRRTYGTRFLK